MGTAEKTHSGVIERNVEDSVSQREPQNIFSEFLLSPVLHAVLIAVVVSICFGRTLTSYFLADDIGQIKYVSAIFDGRMDLLWSNFTGNYMQIAGMSVYRPGLLMTLVCDYLLYKANAVGYYVTNLAYFTGDALLIYAVAGQLMYHWERWRRRIVGLIAALLFAVSPLHCESVSWVVGRVDTACCFYYLSALLCFLRVRTGSNRWWTALGVVLYLLAITVKEMAIGLPALLLSIGFFTSDKRSERPWSLTTALCEGWKLSSPVWIATSGYFVVRFITLGTLLGGYTGSIGATQGDHALSRWLDGDTLHRLLFPFAHGVFSNPGTYSSLLLCCYSGLVAVLGLRAISGAVPWRLVFLSLAWVVTTLAPIYKLWGIGYNLEGARFCFFLSAAISVVVPLVMLSPGSLLPPKVEKRINVFAMLIFALWICVLAKTTYSTNLAWVHAGKEVRFVSEAARQLSVAEPKEGNLLLLGVPKEHVGAHMILNGDTFKMLLGKPHSETESWQRFRTFDPMLFGPEQYINASRFRRLAAETVAGERDPKVHIWSSANKRFEQICLQAPRRNLAAPVLFNIPEFSRVQESSIALSLAEDDRSSASFATAVPYTDGHATYSFSPTHLTAHDALAGDGVRLSGVKVNPLEYDFLEFRYRSKSCLPVMFTVRWFGDRIGEKTYKEEIVPRCVAYKEMTAASSTESRVVRVRVSKYWRWFSAPAVTELQVMFSPQTEIEVSDLRLISGVELIPSIGVAGLVEETVGCYRVTKQPVVLNASASAVQGVSRVQFEISKCNYFFDNYNEQQEESAVQRTVVVSGSVAQLQLSSKELSDPGYYQIRVRGLDAMGKPVGEYSDPITLALN